MRCLNCDYDKQLKEKKEKVLYKESGLSNVVLNGVLVSKCPQCGEVYYDYGDINELHKTIADAIVHRALPISGSELRFLRTYLGLSGATLAKKLGYERETISRFENGKPIPLVLDAAIRGMVVRQEHDRDYDTHDAELQDDESKLIELYAKGNTWAHC